MNSFSEAVRLAVDKGGYGNSQNFTEENLRFFIRATQAKTNNSVCLDPLFWQALGKALNWEMQICGECANCDYACGENGIADCVGDRSKNWVQRK